MDWILRKSKKFNYHTDLSAVLKPLTDDISRFNWFLTDLAFGDLRADTSTPLPINHKEKYFLLSPENFQKLLDSNLQIDWGVVLAIPRDHSIDLDIDELPYADGNSDIWKSGGIQLKDASIEIDCIDSGYTIVKFKDARLASMFRDYFEEAILLDKFKG